MYVMYHAFKHIMYHVFNMHSCYNPYAFHNQFPFLTCTYLSHTRCSSIMLQYHTIHTYKVMQPFIIYISMYLYIYIHTIYHINHPICIDSYMQVSFTLWHTQVSHFIMQNSCKHLSCHLCSITRNISYHIHTYHITYITIMHVHHSYTYIYHNHLHHTYTCL